MKYAIDLHRSESKTVYIEADSPQAAIEAARRDHKGWRAEDATEIDIETEEEGATFALMAECENCGKMMFNDDETIRTTDDIPLCPECHEGFSQTTAP